MSSSQTDRSETETYCSKCGGTTPHTVTLYGLVCDLCGTPRPVHGEGENET